MLDAVAVRSPDTASTFQLSGRLACALIWASSSISSSLNNRRQPFGDRLEGRALVLAHTRAELSTSSSVAWRLGTGLPSWSGWVDERVVDRPSPPAAKRLMEEGGDGPGLVVVRAALQRGRAHDVAAEGAVADQEAGVDGDPAVEASRYSPKDSHDQSMPSSSAARGMPSTWAIMRGCSRRRRRGWGPG